MTRAISLHDVSKSYTRGARVVDRLSLDITPGEFLVLLGPSGCGKSTVLRMIAGLEEIDEGQLLLDGEYANDLPPSGRDMAMVFQNFALYPNMTSRANIGFPLRIEDPGADPRPRGGAHPPRVRHGGWGRPRGPQRSPPRPLPGRVRVPLAVPPQGVLGPD
ncbi:ATP-binding cassette domain-containing protein, partial [Streptomyces luteogriseus]